MSYKYSLARMPLMILLLLTSIVFLTWLFVVDLPSQEKLWGVFLFIIFIAYMINHLMKLLCNPKELKIEGNSLRFHYYNRPKKVIDVKDIKSLEFSDESRLLRKIRNLNIHLNNNEVIIIFYNISNFEELIRRLSNLTGSSPGSRV